MGWRALGHYAARWVLVVIIVGGLLHACGGGGRKPDPQPRATVLHYEDPATFTDGSPLPADTLVRRVYCGTEPPVYEEVVLDGSEIPLGELIEQANLPHGATVYCVGTAEVAGVVGAPSNQVQFRCIRLGAQALCFGR
jgi:hypothetical protein